MLNNDRRIGLIEETDPPASAGGFYLNDEGSHDRADRLGNKPHIPGFECLHEVGGNDSLAGEIGCGVETLCLCHAALIL